MSKQPNKYNSYQPRTLHEAGETDLSLCTDEQLWRQFKAGNKKAFDLIYNTFFQSLCAYGDKICPDKSLVEDTIQDLFIYLWSKRESLGETNAIKFYLFRCLRRKLIKTLTQKKQKPNAFSLLSPDGMKFQLSLKDTPDTSLEEIALRQNLHRALQTLTDRQKEAIYLKFYNNLSFQEVSSIMEIEVRSVYNLIGRTIDILRKQLQSSPVPITTIAHFLLFLFLEYL